MTARSTPRNPWHALIVLCVANFLILLDTTIVNTAIPSIMATLGTGIDSALWVLNGYLLAFASLLIIFGRLGDVLGARPLFVGGLGLFTLASVLCGLSGSPGELVTARVVQGIGAAILVPQALVLISAIFPPDRRGRRPRGRRVRDLHGGRRNRLHQRADPGWSPRHRTGLAVDLLPQRSGRPGRDRARRAPRA